MAAEQKEWHVGVEPRSRSVAEAGVVGGRKGSRAGARGSWGPLGRAGTCCVGSRERFGAGGGQECTWAAGGWIGGAAVAARAGDRARPGLDQSVAPERGAGSGVGGGSSLWAQALVGGGPLSAGVSRSSLSRPHGWPVGWGFMLPAFPLPTPGRALGVLGPLQARSPQSTSTRPPQMTAWAPSNWTSGPTSPSSPTRPASASEQCRRHHRTPARLPSPPRGPVSLFLDFIFCLFLFASPSLTCSPHFQFFLQPSAKLTSAVPAALPPGSCPVLTFVPRPGFGRLSTARPRTRPSGGWRGSGF